LNFSIHIRNEFDGMTRFIALVLVVVFLSACHVDSYVSTGISGSGRRIAVCAVSMDRSRNDADGDDINLSDLWNMEGDDDDELWSDIGCNDHERRMSDEQGEDEAALKVDEFQGLALGGTLQDGSDKFQSDRRIFEEDEDDEIWPGATGEIQRLQLLNQRTKAPEETSTTLLKPPKPTLVRRKQRPHEFWNERLELLRTYKDEHGHIDVPYRFEVQMTGKSVKLGFFIYWLRSQFERETLKGTAPFDFVKELTHLGMKWRYLGKGRRQQLFLQRLNEWRDADRKGRMEPILRTWMWRQRYQYIRRCEGLPSTLNPERVDALVDGGIIPFQRPLKALQNVWDASWNKNLDDWNHFNANRESLRISDSTTLWAWEQWRMYDILRGDIPYKGDLPVTLTGLRVKKLQDAAFFESERPLSILTPPDVETSDLAIEWSDVINAINSYFFDNGNFNIEPSCQIYVANESLYLICARLKREYYLRRSTGELEGQIVLLNDDRTKELEALTFFQTTTVDVFQSEFEWWDQYHKFKKGRREFLIGNTHADSICRWLEQQQERVSSMLEQGDDPCGMNEAHYEALRNLGVDFAIPGKENHHSGHNIVTNVVGRPPALVKLNEDILPIEGYLLRKQSDALEELAWRLRYDEMRAFVEREGHS
jgi:hypothetical protein